MTIAVLCGEQLSFDTPHSPDAITSISCKLELKDSGRDGRAQTIQFTREVRFRGKILTRGKQNLKQAGVQIA
jgi:hypothetical protein